MEINATGGIVNQIVLLTTGKYLPSPPGIFCSKCCYNEIPLTIDIRIISEEGGIHSLRNMQKFHDRNIWITFIMQGVECSQMNVATVQRYCFSHPVWIAEKLQ